MTDKLTQIEKRYLEVESGLSDADVVSDMERYKALMKEYKELTPITVAFRAYKKSASDLEEAELLLGED
ncbi:MAG: PCRF domain-containing protein, partial [Clostridia bacterium]|nr:PCRF domain-containing protein [Clostridia bacterium]